MALKELLVASDSELDQLGSDSGSQDVNSDPNGATSTDVTEPGLCIECGDQPAELSCLNCEEDFCSVCFNYLHRTGNRKSHNTRPFKLTPTDVNNDVNDDAVSVHMRLDSDSAEKDDNEDEDEDDEMSSDDSSSATSSSVSREAKADEEHADAHDNAATASALKNISVTRGEGITTSHDLLIAIKNHSKYIPMRLTYEERKLLRLLEAALNVSEYVDKVDVLRYSSQARRMVAQLKEMCSILAGLVVATNMQAGQTLFEDKDFASNAEWFQNVFEIGRRYKIMNPEKMRDSFGKLMYMIMDSRLPEVREAMEFDLYKPVKTVFGFLKANDALDILDDPLVLQATQEIIPDGKSRSAVQMDIRRKERAIEILVSKYSKNGNVTKEDLRQSLYSISDYHAYLRANRQPVEELMKLLEKNFDPSNGKGEFSLGISYGRGGARLSHDHTKQFHYVRQSLTLWSQIMRDMFMLWTLADDDLLSTSNRYRLSDTGQGLNRIKPCPSVARAMHNIIHKAQTRTGSWIGSSVVHLGDHAVPNALFFLDKYLQVPRILNPVYLTIKDIDRVAKDRYVLDQINAQFESVETLRKAILCDFFRHAFDGSGADNFYDAGSCIDGRLTSAWNWTNTISKKDYYKIFLLTGFTGFNGSDGFV